MKKILLLLLYVLHSSLRCLGYDFKIDGIYYNIKGNDVSVASGDNRSSYSGNVIIPETVIYNGTTYSVTSIDGSAFQLCYLTSVTIGNSVTTIGSYAFAQCWKLTSVTIGNSVADIGSNAFCSCTGLTSIDLPESVTNIGWKAFDRLTVSMPVCCRTQDFGMKQFA